MKQRIVIEGDEPMGYSADFSSQELEDTTKLRPMADGSIEEWDDEVGHYVLETPLPEPTQEELRRRDEWEERYREQVVASALDGPEEIAFTPGVSYDDEILGDANVYNYERDWAASREERRSLGVQGLVERKRFTDRSPGRPRADRGLAHDVAAIRNLLEEAAREAGFTFAAFVAPFPGGAPSIETRKRRGALAAAVHELRAAGATVQAIGAVINRAPGRVSELTRTAQPNPKQSPSS